MIYLLLLPISLIILNIWVWLFDNIFLFKENKNRIFYTTIMMGIFSGSFMLVYPFLVNFFKLDQLDFTAITNGYSIKILLYFIAYLFLIISVFRLIVGNFRFTSFYLKNFIIFVLLFLIFGGLGINFFTGGFLIYYIFVAFGEEILKYFSGFNFWEKYKLLENDLIVFSILGAVGFAFVENIVYMIGGISGQSFLNGLLIGGGMLFTRGILGFLVHIIFTGTIGLFQYIGLNKKNQIIYILVSIIIGTGLHYLYDVSLQYDHKFIIIIYIIFGYFFLSYLFFKSDRIYIRDGLQSI